MWATSSGRPASGRTSITRSIPDGVGVRYVEGIDDGWHDTQFLSQPGTTCLDNMDLTALSVANLSGRSAGSDLGASEPRARQSDQGRVHQAAQLQVQVEGLRHLSGRGTRSTNGAQQEQSKHTPDPFAGPWNHWPVGLNPSDGRYAVSTTA